MRIILADHHAQPRWALKLLLEEQPEWDVVGEAVEGDELLRLAAEQKADLVLVDQELPGSDICKLIARLHELQPRPFVVVLSSQLECSAEMMSAGADSFVSKMDRPERLLEILFKFARQINLGKDARQEHSLPDSEENKGEKS